MPTGEHFSPPEAVERLHVYSKGIPRLINLLCEHSLISAFADHDTLISSDRIERTATDLQLQQEMNDSSESSADRQPTPEEDELLHTLSLAVRNIRRMNNTV